MFELLVLIIAIFGLSDDSALFSEIDLESRSAQSSKPLIILKTFNDESRKEDQIVPSLEQVAFFQAGRPTIPNASDRGNALKLIKDIFKEEYSSRLPQERKKLAEQLLTQSADADNLPTKYVLLSEAISIANSIGDPDTAFKAIAELAKSFDVDELKWQIEALNDLSKKAKSLEAYKYILSKVNSLNTQAMKANRLDEASRLIALGLVTARKARDTNATSSYTSQKRDLALLKKQYDAAAKALETLKANPTDGEANLIVGQYIGFYKKEFEKGLSYLARSSDENLSKLSLLDLEQPSDAKKQIELGDAWYEYGMTQSNPTKVTVLSRAGYWYQQAMSKVSSLEKVAIKKKIEKINKEGGSATASVAQIAMSKPWAILWSHGAMAEYLFLANGKVEYQGKLKPWSWVILEEGGIQWDEGGALGKLFFSKGPNGYIGSATYRLKGKEQDLYTGKAK